MQYPRTHPSLIAVILVAFLAGCDKAPQEDESTPYDLARFDISNTQASERLGASHLAVRAPVFDLAEDIYPQLRIAAVPAQTAKDMLFKRHQMISGEPLQEDVVLDRNDIFIVDNQHASYWVNKHSGAFAYINKDVSKRVSHTEIADHKAAVRLALDHAVTLGLLDPNDKETVDIISVGQVMNALVEDGQDIPIEQFPSEYVIKFGRRFQGVPVIGSYLQIEIGPKGDLIGVKQNWRPIIQPEQIMTKVDPSVIDHLTMVNLREADDSQSEEEPKIMGRICGYLEAPLGYLQEAMIVGCRVAYRRGDDEMTPSVTFALGDWDGSPYGLAPKRSVQMPDDQPTPGDVKDEGGVDELM